MAITTKTASFMIDRRTLDCTSESTGKTSSINDDLFYAASLLVHVLGIRLGQPRFEICSRLNIVPSPLTLRACFCEHGCDDHALQDHSVCGEAYCSVIFQG